MEFVNCGWILVIMFVIILISKIVAPEESYEYKFSLILLIIGAGIFAYKFISKIEDDFNLWPLIYFGICCIYIYQGGKTVALKTVSGVFSKIKKRPIGIMTAGTNWADPIFESVTDNPDGVPNKSIDLQKLQIKIAETNLMQTKTRGIQAKVKKISFMLKIDGDIRLLLDIEGGAEDARERIIEYVDEFFLDTICELLPEELDQNKKNTIHRLARELRLKVNEFCSTNNYPYKVVDDVIIADTELDVEYYKVLARKEFAKLEQDAVDVEAERLKKRLLDLGNSLLPNETANEKLKAAMTSLKITPESIERKIFGVSPEISILLKELTNILKK